MRGSWVAVLVVVACCVAVGQAASPQATALMDRVWDYYGGLPSFFAQARVETRFFLGMVGMPGGEGLWVSEDTQRTTLWYSPPYMRSESELLSSSATVGEVEVSAVAIYDLARGRVFRQRPVGTWEWAPLDLLTPFQEFVVPQVLFGFSPTYVYLSLEEGELDGRRAWVVHAEDELKIEMFAYRTVGKTSATFWVDPRTLRILRVSDSTVVTTTVVGALPPWLQGPEPGELITHTITLSTLTTWEEFIPGLVVPSELFVIPEGPMKGAMGAVEPYPAPQFRARDLAGDELALSDLRGRVVVVYFWDAALSVGYENLMSLQYYLDLVGPEVAVVGVAVGGKDQPFPAELIAERLRGLGITFPTIPDPEWEIAALYGVDDSPALFIIDPQGLVRCRDTQSTHVFHWIWSLTRKRS